MKTPPTPGKELPLHSKTPLPFLPLQQPVLTLSAIIIITVMMLSILGAMLTPKDFKIIFILIQFLTTVVLIGMTVKANIARRKEAAALRPKITAFVEAVQARYNVDMTETIAYRLVEGGVTCLPDKDSNMTVMKLHSDPATETSTLVIDENH